MRVGRHVAQRRRRLGWSQAELAKRARLSRSTVSSAELGANATTLHTLQQIAAAFDVSLEELLCNGARHPGVSDAMPAYDPDPSQHLAEAYHLTTQQALALDRFLRHLQIGAP